jgi:hypothetical protein
MAGGASGGTASRSASGTALPALDAEQLAPLLDMLADADAVELKVSVPDSDRRPVLAALGVDPLKAEIRQVAFIDTADLSLSKGGVTVRARRTQHRPADVVVKLRPMDPGRLRRKTRRLPGFKVEVDASPAGFVCSCSIKQKVPDHQVRELLAGRIPALEVVTERLASVFDEYAPQDVERDAMLVLGPVHVLRRRFTPHGYARRLVAELWFLPDGPRLLELSSRCPPSDAFQAAAEIKLFLAAHGVDLDAPQELKTRSTLAALVANLPTETPEPTE